MVGASYRFKIYAKALTSGTSIRFSTNPNALYSANYTITDDWTELSWTFIANVPETRIVLDLGTNANTYYLDDASLDENGNRIYTGTDEEKDEFQRSEYERIFGLYWNHPSVIGITLWGYRMGMWRSEQAAYIMDPFVGAERPAISDYLNSVIRNGENPPLNPLFAPILEVTPELTINGVNAQYSDGVELKVVIANGARRCNIATNSATFNLLNGTSRELGTTEFSIVGDDLEATLDVILFEEGTSFIAPGQYAISVSLNGTDSLVYSVNSVGTYTLTVEQEDALVYYTGSLVSTKN